MTPSFLDPGSVLFGKTRRRVLGLLFGHPDEGFYVRDIVRRSGAAQGAIARELDALLGADVVERYEDGRNVYYRANKRAPIFPELERLVAKTIALDDTVREALAPLAGRIEFAVLFGDAAADQSKAGRAINLLVIGDVRPTEVAEALAVAKERRALNHKVFAMADFKKRVADDSGFFMGFVARTAVGVIGEHAAFRRLRTSRWSKRTA
jgi:DNA-binding transcriptional ArsR family regulator